MKTEPYNRTGHLQEQIEYILKDDPLMSRADLLLRYMQSHCRFTENQMLSFLAMLHFVPVDSILRYARKYRQKLGIRDEVRQGLAEQERRYWPAQKNLEENPPIAEPEKHAEDCDCFPCGQKADMQYENLLDMIAGGN